MRPPKFLSGSLARATVSASALLALRLVVLAAFLLIVTRLLGASLFGVFSGVAALAVLIGGMGTAGAHLVLLAEVSIDPARRNPILSWVLPTVSCFSLLLFCLYLALGIPLLRQAGLPLDIALAIGAAEIGIQPFALLVIMEKQARNEIARSQVLQILPLLFRLFAVTVLYAIQPENALRIFAWAYLGASAAAFFITLLQRHEKWPAWRTCRFPSWQEFRHALGYATLQFAAAAPLEADKTLALRLTPNSVAGIYATATRIIGALTLPVTAMMIAAQPRLFRQHAEGSQDSPTLQRWIFVIALAYGILIALCIAAAAPLLEKLFGESYAGLSDILRLLAFVTPALSLQVSAGSIFMTRNKPWHRATLELLGFAVLILAATLPDFSEPSIRMPFALGCAEWCLAVAGWMLVYRHASSRHTMPS